MNRRKFIDIMSGKLQTPWAPLWRAAAWAASGPYAAVMVLRRRLYELGILPSRKAAVPVISVGNITTGGTGKTPMVALLAEQLAARGRRPAVLTRGYRGRNGSGDEPEMLRSLSFGSTGVSPVNRVEVVVNPDRVAGAAQAVAGGANVLVMDDGFQHLRLRRDLDIVLIDATTPFGYGYCLPRGLLREPAGVLSRAGLIVITRTDELPARQLSALRGQVDRLSAGRPVALAVHRPQCLSNGDGARLDLAQLHGKKICAFCGIGNPDSFFATLERAGASVVEKVAFDDHAQYSPAELEHVLCAAQNWQADAVVTTAKDRVKLDGRLFARPLWTLQVCMELTEGQELLDGALDGVLGK